MRFLPAFLALSIALPAVSARADRTEIESRWLPSASVTLGISNQEASSSLSSTVRPTGNEGAVINETRSVVSPSIGGSIELMSPVVLDLPGRPRIFAHGDLVPLLTTERKLAIEGAAGDLEAPINQGNFGEAAITGQGSFSSIDMGTLAYGAGLGVAFHFELFDLEMAVRPSVEWYRYQGTLRGFVSRAFKTGVNLLPPDREVQLRATERRNWNAVGGGLEIEAEVFEEESISALFFAFGRYYENIGDRSIETRASNLNGDMATFTYKNSADLYNFGVGFRLRWIGGQFTR